MASVLFSDTFEIGKLDWDHVAKKYEKKFDKVSRIEAKSETYDTELTLDVNTEIYPLRSGEKIEVLLSNTLSENGQDEETGYDPTQSLGERGNAYEYIMHGTVFKYAEEGANTIVYLSFGGLLMALKGETKALMSSGFVVDAKIYLFVRKM